LSKQQAELIGSSLKRCDLLHQDNEICFFRNRQNEFEEVFSQENDLLFCNYVCCVTEALRHQHDPTEWRLSTDPSKVVLKALLLHYGKKFPSVPPPNVANMQESYDMKLFRKRSSIKNIIGTFVGNKT
jgi:hypothetical protein